MSSELKRVLSGIMVAGDIMLAIIFLFMLLNGELFGLSVFMLAFLAVDAYLSIDYMKQLSHRMKVEESLKRDNDAVKRARRKKVARQPVHETIVPEVVGEEEDLSDILSGNSEISQPMKK
ncbi:MAG: hypothetical protein K6D03_05580 [Solobacterium sp.]|nr:hypothetical protein [Solobacterium sp.]